MKLVEKLNLANVRSGDSSPVSKQPHPPYIAFPPIIPHSTPMPQSLMVFDTNCVLCSGAVRFILKHERDSDIQFLNAWSEAGLAEGAKFGLSKDDLNETFLFVSDGQGHTHSTGVLALARHLKMPWRAVRVFWIVPKPMRDWAYRFIAKRRYKLFGYEENCLVIRPEERHRFIDV